MQTLSDLPLMPIGRIATSGPDTAPKNYADQGLGATWFTAAPSPEPAADPGSNGPGEGPAADEPAGPSERGAEPDSAVAPSGEAGGMVLDFDITALVNGTGEQPVVVAAPDELPVRRSKVPPLPADGTAAGRAGTAGTEWASRDESKTRAASADAPSSPGVRKPRPLAAEDLAAIRWRLDGGTLREVVDDRDALRELGVRLDEPLAEEADSVTRSGLLSVRAEVYRLLGELGLAAAASRLALANAESCGDAQSIVIAQAELAHVLRLRGDFGEADRLFELAAGSDAPDELRSVVHENAGRSCFDQGRHMEALDHFARSVRLGRPDDTELVERIDVSLEAVYIHALRDGWGPYPRLRREILGGRR